MPGGGMPMIPWGGWGGGGSPGSEVGMGGG